MNCPAPVKFDKYQDVPSHSQAGATCIKRFVDPYSTVPSTKFELTLNAFFNLVTDIFVKDILPGWSSYQVTLKQEKDLTHASQDFALFTINHLFDHRTFVWKPLCCARLTNDSITLKLDIHRQPPLLWKKCYEVTKCLYVNCPLLWIIQLDFGRKYFLETHFQEDASWHVKEASR